MRNKIFAILYYSSKLNAIKFIGTGFMISKKGDFITAGHTFGKLEQLILDNNKFRAVFIDNSNNYKCATFSTICYKYLKQDKQNPPILYDIAYGCLEKGEYEYFKINDELPIINERLEAAHYKHHDKSKTFGESFSELINIGLLGYFQLPMSVSSNMSATINGKSYTNCIELKQSSRIEKGASGCPLVNNNGFVSGFFIAVSNDSATYDNRYALNPLSIIELGK